MDSIMDLKFARVRSPCPNSDGIRLDVAQHGTMCETNGVAFSMDDHCTRQDGHQDHETVHSRRLGHVSLHAKSQSRIGAKCGTGFRFSFWKKKGPLFERPLLAQFEYSLGRAPILTAKAKSFEWLEATLRRLVGLGTIFEETLRASSL